MPSPSPAPAGLQSTLSRRIARAKLNRLGIDHVEVKKR